MEQTLLTAGRLLLAAVLGGGIGYQRELKDRPAGFRTHVMVCVGSTLFMLVSIYNPGGQAADPTRIAAGVVTGIGFLGAGSIIRQGNVVLGLTTAASLWGVAAVGLAVGVGYYSAALVGTVVMFMALTLFKTIEERLVGSTERRVLQVVGLERPGFKDTVGDGLTALGLSAELIEMSREPGGHLSIRLAVDIPGDVSFSTAIQRVWEMEGISSVRWEP